MFQMQSQNMTSVVFIGFIINDTEKLSIIESFVSLVNACLYMYTYLSQNCYTLTHPGNNHCLESLLESI